ncbi:uncharacterized protein [Dysidea avara]|uniref:uncharacterized protein isoform X2 n=1 Tax=Dysidea avara TaxID=196820 RepID=UPI003333D1FB
MTTSSEVERVYESIQRFLQLKKESNKDLSKRSAPYVPSDVTSKDSLDLVPPSGLPSSDDNGGEDVTKKMDNLYKRINELEVVNDSLRQKQSIEEGSISDEISNDTEKSGDDANASVAQLKLQRDKLRVELNKSSEHKKKMEQYSIEAKQQAQRLSAENEQLKESLKKANFDMEQATESYRAESRKFKNHHSVSTGSAKQTIFDRNIEHWMKTARLHLINDEVARLLKTQVELISHSRTAAITQHLVDSSHDSSAVDNVNYEVKPEESPSTVASVLDVKVPLSISSVVIVGLPGATKTNFTTQLFSYYSVNAQSNGQDKDITLTTVDIERDSTGKVSWANCPGDSCDVLVQMLYSKCTEKGVSVVDLLKELASHDSTRSLSESQNKSFYSFLNKFQKNLKASKSQTAAMYGMSQIFDLSHTSSSYAQIPVLFSTKNRIITIFVYEHTSWTEFSHCPHTGNMSPADCILYWATLLGHFKSDTHSMLVAVKGDSNNASMLLSDLTSKTKEFGLKNIFHNCVFPFEVNDNNGIVTIQEHLDGLLMKFSKDIKLSWLMFHDALTEVSEWPWISYKLVKEVASIFHIGESELVEVMEFWSSSGSMLYKDTDQLKDVVFRNTLWLADELSKVLHLSHSLSPLLKYGIVEQCVVEQHWLNIPTPNSNSTMAGPSQLMLDYLKSLNLTTLIPRVEEKQHLQCNCYFLPSLLKAAPEIREKNLSSLFISFSQSFVPLQIFSQIVVLLLRDEKLPCGLKKVHQYSNKITLSLEPCCTIVLTEHPFVIEVTYQCFYCSQPKEQYVKLIRNNIKACCGGLQLDYKFHLRCPNGAHYITVPNVKRSFTHCSTCTSNVNLSSGQLFWVVEYANLAVKPTETTPSTVPELTEEHLVKISRQINARDTHRIATELGFFDAEYEHILSFAQDKRVALYLLITWLDRNSHLDNKHEVLDQALIATGYKSLATLSIDLLVEQKKPIEDSDLRILAEHINKSWQTLAFLVDIHSEKDMSKLGQLDDVDAAHHVLKQWYNNFTGVNPHKELVERLHKYDSSLAYHFEQGTLNSYKSTSKRFL